MGLTFDNSKQALEHSKFIYERSPLCMYNLLLLVLFIINFLFFKCFWCWVLLLYCFHFKRTVWENLLVRPHVFRVVQRAFLSGIREAADSSPDAPPRPLRLASNQARHVVPILHPPKNLCKDLDRKSVV